MLKDKTYVTKNNYNLLIQSVNNTVKVSDNGIIQTWISNEKDAAFEASTCTLANEMGLKIGYDSDCKPVVYLETITNNINLAIDKLNSFLNKVNINRNKRLLPIDELYTKLAETLQATIAYIKLKQSTMLLITDNNENDCLITVDTYGTYSVSDNGLLQLALDSNSSKDFYLQALKLVHKYHLQPDADRDKRACAVKYLPDYKVYPDAKKQYSDVLKAVNEVLLFDNALVNLVNSN